MTNILMYSNITYFVSSLLRATQERAIYNGVDQFHHRPLLATHICFVYCVITAVQNVFQTQSSCVSSQQQKAELSYINPNFYTECAHLLTFRYFLFISDHSNFCDLTRACSMVQRLYILKRMLLRRWRTLMKLLLSFYYQVLTSEQACAALAEVSPGSRLVNMSLRGNALSKSRIFGTARNFDFPQVMLIFISIINQKY